MLSDSTKYNRARYVGVDLTIINERLKLSWSKVESLNNPKHDSILKYLMSSIDSYIECRC